MEYVRFTKELQIEKTCKMVTCKFRGTDKCSIHNTSGHCEDCEVFGAMLTQLSMYENVLEKMIKNEGVIE